MKTLVSLSITALVAFCWAGEAPAATVTPAPKTGSSAVIAPSTATQAVPKINSGLGQAISPCPPVAATMTTGQPPAGGGGSVVGSLPTTVAQPLTYAGPTPSITAVANGIGLRSKSLTTLVTFRPSLPISKPVKITIDYSSPAAQSRTAQNYDCNGNRFLYNDPMSGAPNTPGYAVWGKPRQMNINITLTEERPGGQPYVYTMPFKLNLDPLFDVVITPLRFTLNTSCESFYRGDADVHFLWYAPDASKYRERAFQSSKGKTTTINEFAWSRQELSGSANVLFPTFSFYEKDSNIFSPLQYDIPKPTIKLLPAASGFVGRTLKDSSGQGGCEASIAFDMNIQLRQYANL